MAQERQQPMPFGYAFDHSFQQSAQHRDLFPTGPPLLSDLENSMIGDFFDNPDDASVNFGQNVDMQFTFGDDRTDLSWALAEDAQINAASVQPQALFDFQPALDRKQSISSYTGDQFVSVNPTQPPLPWDPALDDTDEGAMGANMLLNLSQDHARSQRMPLQRRYSEVLAANRPHTIDTAQQGSITQQRCRLNAPRSASTYSDFHNFNYPSGVPALLDRTGSGGSHHSANTAGLHSRQPVTNTIPNELPFNTDRSFAYSANNFAGYTPSLRQPSDQEIAMSHMNYSSFIPFGSGSISGSVSGSMAPPTRRNTDITSGSNTAPPSPPTVLDSPVDVKTPLANRHKKKSLSVSAVQAQISNDPARFNNTSVSQGFDSPGASSTASSTPATHADSPIGHANGSAQKRRQNSSSGPTGLQTASVSKRQKLTDEQRKNNHIESEKRRRAEMKKGYDDLDELVPGLKSGGLSKSQILQSVVQYTNSLLGGNDRIEQMLLEKLCSGKPGKV